MGEQQQFPAPEGDSEGPEEDINSLHPSTLQQGNSWILTNFMGSAIKVMASNGWLMVALAALAYAVWYWLQKTGKLQAAADHHKNPDKFLAQEQAIGAARQKMQEQYDATARRMAEDRQKKAEEEPMPQPKPKPKLPETPSQPRQRGQTAAKKSTGQPKLRPEYNPLMGDGGSCGYRPSARGGGAGGG